MAKMGRPRKEFDKDLFIELCNIQCTLTEIAGCFRCNVDTVTDWCKREFGETFSEVFKKYSQDGKISLRRAQFRLAERNAPMAIFLGKQYLGQKDNVDSEEDNEELLKELKKIEIKFIDAGGGNNIADDGSSKTV